MKKTILLQGIGDINQYILIKLKKDLLGILKGSVKTIQYAETSIPLDNSFYDPRRRKYDGSQILNRLKNIFEKSDYLCVLGVIDEDLYSGFRNFIFGVAESRLSKFPGIAVISTYRLRDKFYGRTENTELFELRSLKEAVHEIGHLFNLDHCNNDCVMIFSTYITDTDKKPSRFCPSCKKKVDEFFLKL